MKTVEDLTREIRAKNLERAYCKSWNAKRVAELTREIKVLSAEREALKAKTGIPSATYYCHY